MRKPIDRSPLRLYLGEKAFTLLRFLQWHHPRLHFATKISKQLLPAIVTTHHTPLLRKLRAVDMHLQHNKTTNLKLAIRHLNGIIIQPGQRLSFWRQIGRPTKRKGYLHGLILNNGQISSDTGGGLCQLSNMLYWLTLHTPLDVVERWRHPYDVFPDARRTQPFGSGATCAYPNIDVQIQNNTDQTFQLHLWIDNKNLYGEWRTQQALPYQYEIYEKNPHINHEVWGGYTRNNEIWRKTIDRKAKKVIQDELITTNQAVMMYNPFLGS